MAEYRTFPKTRAFSPNSTRRVASISPLTMPLRMTLDTLTDPSMPPCSLTDRIASAFDPPLTLPLM